MTRRTRTPAEAKEHILAMFARTVRPVLIGQACLELSWPISWVEKLFDELVEEKKIRLLTKEEAFRFDVPHGFFRA